MRIYVGNLHHNVSEAQVKGLFNNFGRVRSVTIVMDRHSGRSREFGYVEMENRQEGLNAMEALSNQNFMGHYLDVKEIPPQP